MSIQQWGLVAGVKGILHDAEKDGKVQGLADTVTKFLTSFFPEDFKAIRLLLVQYLLFPLGRLLLKDDPSGYAEAKKGL